MFKMSNSVNESTIIPFGKYRNTTLQDIYNKDQQYLQWLNTQPWFKIKFSSIHNSLETFLEENNEKIQQIKNEQQQIIKKFNEKYSTLLSEQKTLLNHFITSFADDGFELNVYLNEEISRLKTIVTEARGNTEEALIVSKLEEVHDYLDDLRKREFEDKDLNKVLMTQALVQELVGNA